MGSLSDGSASAAVRRAGSASSAKRAAPLLVTSSTALDADSRAALEQAAADKEGDLLKNVQAHREAYINYFVARLAERGRWLQGVIDARA